MKTCRIPAIQQGAKLSGLVVGFFAMQVVLSTHADPLLTTWMTNNSAQYARVYTNSTGRLAGKSGTTWTNQSLPVYSDIQVISYSSSWVYVQSSGLASYVMGEWTTPGGQTAALWPTNQHSIRRFPRSPAVQAGAKDTTPAAYSGIFVNGVAIFNSLDGKAWNGSSDVSGAHTQSTYYWHRNAPEAETFDGANGHQPPNGIYHTHQNPLGVRYQLGDHVTYNSSTKLYSESTSSNLTHSPIVGWAHDGCPVYGPYGYSTATNSSSGVRRVVSGYAKRDGSNGTDILSTNLYIIPAWYARYRQSHFGGGYSTTATTARPSTGSVSLGTYAEDWAYLGDCGKTQGVDFDLDEYNGRYCVTPEYPGGTYAYFITIDSSGASTYPYTFAYEFYGNATGGSVTSITEPVTTNFVGGQNVSVKLNTPAVTNTTVTLVWSSVEGGTYQVETSTNQINWTTQLTNIVANGTTAQTNFSGSNGTGYARVTRTSLASYDAVYSGGSSTQTATGSYTVSALSITTQPQSQSVVIGSDVTFSVTAGGISPFSYQWRKDGSDIADATFSSYTIEGVQASDVATYSVVVTNAYGSITSSNAVLTIANSAPTLSSIATLTGASQNTPFTISYATLAAAADEADINGDAISFRLESLTSGTLTKDGTNAVAGSTLLSTNENWVWTPATNVNGTLAAFTVKAWDGSAASSAAVQVNVTVRAPNQAPLLFPIGTFTGATQDTPFTITYTALATASMVSDYDGDTISFRIESISSGTVTKNGTNVVTGSTLLSSGEDLVWTPATNASGTALAAFTVSAWDGTASSTNIGQVYVTVAAGTAKNMVLSKASSTNGLGDIFYVTAGNNVMTFESDTVTAALGQTISLSNALSGPVGWQMTSISLRSQRIQTLLSNVTWTLTFVEWQPSTNSSDLRYWTNGTDADSLAGFTSPKIILKDSGSIATNTTFNGSDLLTFTFDTSKYYIIQTNKAYGFYFSLANMTTNWIARSQYGAGYGGGVALYNPVGSPSTTLPAFDLDFFLDGVTVSNLNTPPTLSSVGMLDGAVVNTPFTITYSTLAAAANEADAETNAISFRVQSVNGTLTKNGTNVVVGSTLLSSNESWVWTPPANASGFVNAFTVVASDGSLASATPVQVVVHVGDGVNQAPTLTSIMTLTNATEDTAFAISYSTLADAADEADTEGGAISFRVESVLAGTLTENGTNVVAGSTLLSMGESWTWTPATNSNGVIAAFSVTASDGATNSATPVIVNINVASVNDRPTVANTIPLQSATYGTFFSYTFPSNTFSDVDSVLTYFLQFSEMGAYPGWLSLDSPTRTMSGTPTNSGRHEILLITTDGSASVGTPVQIDVAKASLSVTPTDAARAYGQSNPVLTGTLIGVANGDVITVTYSTTATTNSPVGTYAITATLVDPNNRLTNYNVTLNTGTLTVTNGNAVPFVTLTGPTTNDLLKAGYTIDLSATASDTDGTVAKVEFFVNSEKVGEAASSPYSVIWTNTAAGTFSLTASATDDAGGTNTSSAVVVTVQPAIHSPQFISSEFQMRFYGVVGLPYDIQYSADLQAWSTLTNVTGVSGGNEVNDSAVSVTNRFYRATLSGPP